MVVEIRRNILDGHLLKWLIAAGVSWLEYHKDQVNSMNVFPVPDGDTGTNMLLTVKKAYQQVADIDETHIGIVSEALARGALTGARGNSGTILSMLMRGFANGLKGREIMDAEAFAAACHSAVDYAYETVSTVMKPVEGTILTVARDSAEAVVDRAQTESDLQILLDHMVAAAHKSLKNTPNLLKMLKEAGVVDSGGMGLVYILEGMQRLLNGDPVVFDNQSYQNGTETAPTWQDALVPEDEEGYGYDVQFLMLGENLDVNQIRRDISAMGWSPLIDGDETMVKVHIHVHNPGEPLSYATTIEGVQLDDIVVENMQAQYLQYVQNRSEREAHAHEPAHDVCVITVARGDGLVEIFNAYQAARVIEGGQTMNPSTEDFLKAIDSLACDEIIILPNNSNIVMAAQQAASLTLNKSVRVVPTKTVPQGIAALLAYGDIVGDDDSTLDDIVAAMKLALQGVITAEVTVATRSVTIDNVEVNQGEVIGLVNGKLVTSGETIDDVVLEVLHKAHTEDHEIVTLYYGATVTQDEVDALIDRLRSDFDDIEFEAVAGGQPLYPYIISIE